MSRRAGRQVGGAIASLAAESLEPRALLAVTASLVGPELQISLGAADDVAYLSNDGTNYIVSGTGLSDTAYGNTLVNAVSVAGTGGTNQSFTVANGAGNVLTDPLTVAAAVEKTTIAGAINTTGAVLVDSAAIMLAADVTTTGQQRYQGAVGLVGPRALAAGTGNVAFGSTVDRITGYIVDTSPQTAAPPSTLGGYTMSAFARTSAVGEGTLVSSVTDAGLTLGFNQTVLKQTVGSGWGTWSNGYKNDVYATYDSANPLALTMTLPAGVHAFYFYVEPNDRGAYSVTASYAGGAPSVTESVSGDSGAKYFGFSSASGSDLVSITVTAAAGSNGFAVGEFGISLGTVDSSLVVNSSGATTFGGAVGGTTPLASLTTDAGGSVSLKSVTTTGAQAYGDDTVTLNGTYTTTDSGFSVAKAANLAGNVTVSAGTGNISFNGTVNDGYALVANSTGTTTFGGAVGGTTPLASLTTDAGGSVSLKSVTTTGAQAYGDDTVTLNGTYTTTDSAFTVSKAATLAGNVAVSTGAGAGDIMFGGTLDGAQQATLAAGIGAVSFKGAVGSVAPLAGLTLTSAASTTAESTVKLAKAADSGQDGLVVAAGVNNVTMTSSGSSVTGFNRNGISFLGGSTTSRLSGFTVSGNGGNGMSFAAGSYTGTTLTANTISDNGDKTTHVGDGILVQGTSLMIGWDASPASNAAANTINNNALNGIRVDGAGAVNNTILSNSIYLNGYVSSGSVVGDGIALTNGGNGGPVAPRILDIVRDTKENKVRVQFIVDAAGSYLVQFFQSTATDERSLFPADANGFEGRSFVVESPVSTLTPVATGKPVIDGTPVITGNTLQTIEFDASLLNGGDWLTATATSLDGTAPTNTSPFSAGVQVLRAPVLAVGGDGQSAMWDREFAYTATGPTTLQISGLTAAQAAFFSRGTQLTITPAGAATTTTASVTANAFNQRAARATITLSGAIPGGGGTLVLGLPSSLPAARLVNASDNTQFSVGNAEIIAALAGVPGLTAAQRNAFATRFQGGLRVAAADFDGDGYTDLVTAPGGVPANLQPSLRNVFGSAGRVITIYNGAPAPTWASASIDVGAVFGSTYLDGFLVTVGNVTTENAGSGNATVELIVASTGKVAVFDVTVAARGAKPVIGPSPTSSKTVVGTITGLASGTFSGPVTGLADIVVAATTATSKTVVNAVNTTTVSLFTPGGGVSSFKVNSLVWNGDPKRSASRQVNVFLNGASLAVGDLDNSIDQKPELVLGAGAGGLGNFRVLAADVVKNANQTAVDSALAQGGQFSQPARGVNSVTKYWQPSGGPDYFVGVPNENVPTPMGFGFNAPLSIAVAESNGKNFRAELFAAIGATNQTPNQIRSFAWDGSRWIGQEWFAVPENGDRLRKGSGLRLG